MKKYTRIITLSILLLNLFTACKKDNSDAPKDYSASLKDKTWAGMFTYTGKTSEYYSVHFNADKSLTWTELSGDYSGKWEVTGKQLVLTFTSGSQIKADITDDNRFINFTNSNTAYSINNGKLVTKPDLILDNSIWKGTITSGISYPLELDFIAGSKVIIYFKNVVQGTYNYKRNGSGGAIIVTTGGLGPFFGVVTGDNEMLGSSVLAATPWQATKQ